ncbi:phytoene desaturase family protein [Priestia koreensis]|uniref:FAD-dependent oxidoreductase n=1 Tax=Priestia koreensis TaxID=284581 RepID=A0A0M0KWE4_9BACI|nr:FAD-dependent oxidoreductase [Priestia koreensis]KOO42937.1 FAD-dependent oxidoreductase [Priestia koreensis]
MKQSVIIVGGGIGGLTAGALLIKAGYEVTILEASREWGGCAGKFQRGDFRFPVGATLGMGFEKGGIHERICRFLGIEIMTKRLDEVMIVHTPTRSISFQSDRQQHVQELQRLFPHVKEKIAAFYEDVRGIAKKIRALMEHLPILPPSTFREWRRLVQSLSPSSLALLPLFSQTLKDLLNKHGLLEEVDFVHFLDGQIIDSMQTTSDDCSLLLGCMAIDIYHEGAFYVEGGLYQLAEKLVSYSKEHGGTLYLGRKVTQIEQGSVWKVTDHRGRVYEAEHVVCNVPIQNLTQLFSAEEMKKMPPKIQHRQDTRQWGAFTLYLALKEDVIPDDMPLFQQVITSSEGEMTNGEHLFLSLSDKEDRNRAPTGYRTLTVSTHIPLDDWKNPATYDEQKKQLNEKMKRGIRTVIPRLEEGVIHEIPGAPRAWERFVQRSGVGGFPQTNEYALFQAISHRTKLDGLWLCGDTVFPGAGTIGVSVSGYHVYESISKRLDLLKRGMWRSK